MFTQEQIKTLAPFEHWFDTAIHLQYARGLSERNLDIIEAEYRIATGEHTLRHWSCSDCVYRFLCKVGKLYYDSISAAKSPKKAPKKSVKK